MLPTLAPVTDLEARLGLDPDTLQDANLARARAALIDASALVRMEARRTWVDEAGALTAVPDAIVRVVLGAARRSYTNPDAAVQESAGPFVRRLNESDTGVYLTRAELDIVRRFRPSGGELWTLRTQRDEDESNTIWYQDTFGTEWFPLASGDDSVWPA
jgi:hypothetical protein